MTFQRQSTGRLGEEEAARFLRQKGYHLLHRNYTCPLGEIDIIAWKDKTLVFVEVRSRTGLSFGLPQESVDSRKQRKLQQLAWYYLKQTGQAEASCRFDVVGVMMDKSGRVKQLEHFQDAF